MNEPPDPLIDEIFRDKVRRARAEKQAGVLSLTGLELFEQVVERMRDGVRCQLPEASPGEVEAELQRRFAISRRRSEQGLYRLPE